MAQKVNRRKDKRKKNSVGPEIALYKEQLPV